MNQKLKIILYLLFMLQGIWATAEDALSDFKNPNPLIEEIHVRAYNLDLGIGVPQDREKANELYLQAAMAGDPRSMMNLAINLIEGQGTEKNLVEAFAWIDIARFYTQKSKDMKVKWSVRSLYDEMKKGLPRYSVKDGQKRAKIILEAMKDYDIEKAAGGDSVR